MPHPVYGPPQHRLDEVVFKLWLPTPANGHQTVVAATGVSSTQRASLWHVKETWEPNRTRGGYEPSDFIVHSALVACQDHPTSQEQYEACIRGEGWCQDELPL